MKIKRTYDSLKFLKKINLNKINKLKLMLFQ